MTLINEIPRILKSVPSTSSISHSAKLLLSNLITYIAIRIVRDAIGFQQYSGSSILNTKHIVNAIRTLFRNDAVMENMVSEGDRVVRIESNKLARKQLLLKPIGFKRIVLSVLPSSSKMGVKVPLFIAAAMQYMCVEILELALAQTSKLRITPLDISSALYYDIELRRICDHLGIVILGTVGTALPAKPFSEMTHTLCADIEAVPVKISRTAMKLLQHYTEFVIVRLLRKANAICLYNNRIKVTVDDIQFALLT